jgi:hypothetical protein
MNDETARVDPAVQPHAGQRSMRRARWLVVLVLVSAPAAVHAQHARPAEAAPPLGAVQKTAPAPALPIELAGGVVGSAVGFGAVVLLSERRQCGDDLSCILGNAAAAVAAGTMGAAVGTYLAGRAADTRPSFIGGATGAVVGAVAAIGLDHLVTEELRIGLSRGGHVALFALTQGTLSAVGSRIGARLR